MTISDNNGELVATGDLKEDLIRFVSRAYFAIAFYMSREQVSRAVHFLASKFRRKLSLAYLLREMVLSDRRQLRRRAR